MWPFKKKKQRETTLLCYCKKKNVADALSKLPAKYARNEFCPVCKKEVPPITDIASPSLVLLDGEYYLLCGDSDCDYLSEGM